MEITICICITNKFDFCNGSSSSRQFNYSGSSIRINNSQCTDTIRFDSTNRSSFISRFFKFACLFVDKIPIAVCTHFRNNYSSSFSFFGTIPSCGFIINQPLTILINSQLIAVTFLSFFAIDSIGNLIAGAII